MSVPCKIGRNRVACGEVTVCINELDAACGRTCMGYHLLGPSLEYLFLKHTGSWENFLFVAIAVVFFVSVDLQSFLSFK